MTSIRLPIEIETKIDQIAESKNITKSKVIREAIEYYIENYSKQSDPFKLGEDLFGKFGSGKSSLSRDYKNVIRRELSEKFSN